MKKTLFGFSAGAALTLTLLKIAESMTYTTNVFLFCLLGDMLAAAAVIIGIVIDRLELTEIQIAAEQAEPAQEDDPVELPPVFAKHEKRPVEMDEVEPIPEMIEVGNDFVKRVEE